MAPLTVEDVLLEYQKSRVGYVPVNHKPMVDLYTELRWTIAEWQQYDYDERWETIETYLAQTVSQLEELDVDAVLNMIADRAEEESDNGSANKKPKKAGDKWASPGRIVCSWPDLDPTARLVMFVMAAHARDDGSNIWISQQAIADYIGMSKRTVQRAMDRLEDAGAIKKTAKARQHKPPTWCLNPGSGVT